MRQIPVGYEEGFHTMYSIDMTCGELRYMLAIRMPRMLFGLCIP